MNKLTRIVAAINSQANHFYLKASLFHSSPVLERRRRTNWENVSSFRSTPRKSFNQYSKRLRKQTLLRNVNEFAENLFENWQSNRDEYDKPPNQQTSWFRPNFRDDGNKKGKGRNRRSQANKSRFEFCDVDDDIEFETIFYSAFSVNSRNFFWSFINDEEPRYRNSSRYSNSYRTFGGRRFQYDEEYDSSSDSEQSGRGIASERLALGLSASGPLNVEDVKNAYRACALKWHPDRHQGSSKVAAEEKFKVCSAAYQSLCHKLAVN